MNQKPTSTKFLTDSKVILGVNFRNGVEVIADEIQAA
jgi:hypothetical protein